MSRKTERESHKFVYEEELKKNEITDGIRGYQVVLRKILKKMKFNLLLNYI